MTKKKILTESLALEDAPKQQSVKEEPEEESIEENIGEVLEKATKRPPLDKPNQPEKTQLPPKKKTMVTCPHCQKNMLEKTYKYYHTLKCYPPSQTQTKQEASSIVEFALGRRVENKCQRYSNLFSKAFQK